MYTPRHPLALLLGVFLTVVSFASAPAQAQQRRVAEFDRPAFPALTLGMQQAAGRAAVSQLGQNIGTVAGWYGKTAAELTAQLLSDKRLRVDSTGRLFAVEELDAALHTAPAPAMQDNIQKGSLVSLDQSFALHSRPGANRTIYLDFNGATITGTAWNSSKGTINAAAYDFDAAPGSFSNAELQRIQYIWQRVAEDYAPFDVDVTTEQPAPDRLTRTSTSDQTFGTTVVITRNSGIYDCGCGGIAYIGVFNDTSERFKPAFVFYDMLGNGDEKAVAEAISHEAGHNIGLSHDGSSSTTYYAGQGTDPATGWAPIMGVGYYKPLVQFSKGEYAGANNKEDDFAVAQSYGLPLRQDDFGNTAYASAPMPLADGGISAMVDGVIETSDDRDVFSFSSGAGVISASITPASRSANADLVLSLLDASGRVLATANPQNALAAGLTFTLQTQGTYYLEARSTGQGDAATSGYSAYGSVGNYRLAVSFTLPTGRAPTAVISANVMAGSGPLAVTFNGAGSTDDGRVAFWYWDFGDGSREDSGSLSSVSHVYQTAGNYVARLTVVDDTGLRATATQNVSVTSPSPQPSAQVLDMKLKSGSRGLSATAAITVVNQNGQPIRGAKVTASWSGAVSRSASRSTSVTGKANFASPPSTAGGCFTLTITGITAPGYSFSKTALPSGQICS
jgi:PKD repeat protein